MNGDNPIRRASSLNLTAPTGGKIVRRTVGRIIKMKKYYKVIFDAGPDWIGYEVYADQASAEEVAKQKVADTNLPAFVVPVYRAE